MTGLNEGIELLYEKYLKERKVLEADYKYKISKGKPTKIIEIMIKLVQIFLNDIETTIGNSKGG